MAEVVKFLCLLDPFPPFPVFIKVLMFFFFYHLDVEARYRISVTEKQ